MVKDSFFVDFNSVVKKGQLIADSAGAVSAKVHAPVAGTVKLTEALLAFGRKCPAILIENDSTDEWVERKENEDYLSILEFP